MHSETFPKKTKSSQKKSFSFDGKIFGWPIKSILALYLFSCIIALLIYCEYFGSSDTIRKNILENITSLPKNIGVMVIFTIIGGFIILGLLLLIGKTKTGGAILTTLLGLIILPAIGFVFIAGLCLPILIMDYLGSRFIWLYIPYFIIYIFVFNILLEKYK